MEIIRKGPLTFYDQELLYESVDICLDQRGQNPESQNTGEEMFGDGVVSRLSPDERRRLEISYLLGYRDAVARVTYTHTGVHEHPSTFAQGLRNLVEKTFQAHRDKQGRS